MPDLTPARRLAAAAVATIVLFSACSGDSGAPEAGTTSSSSSSTTAPATVTSAPRPRLTTADLEVAGPAESVPSTYRVVYDVVENGVPNTQTVVVQRPFEAVVTTERDGVLIGGAAASITNLYSFFDSRGGWAPIQEGRHRAPFDLRVSPVLGVLEGLGLVERLDDGEVDDEVAGRPCVWYRTGAPTTASVVTAPNDEESTEICVDAEGLVLRETWRLGGEVVVDRVATSVETGAALDAARFDPTPVIDDDEVAALLTTVVIPLDSDLEAQLTTDLALPAGFVIDGGVARSALSAQGAPSSAEIVRFVRAGPELVEVSEVVGAGAEAEPSDGYRVDVDGWDEVWFVPSLRASSLRVRLDDDRTLEIEGASPATLLAVLAGVTRR